MDFFRERARDVWKVKWICDQACENFFRPPNRTTQEKVVASGSDCEHEEREFTVDSGASLHMMSKDEVTSSEKDQRTHRHRQRQGRVSTTIWTSLSQ